MHGLSILFATMAVLLGWAPPQHHTTHRGSTSDQMRTQEDAVEAPDPRSIDLVDDLADLTLLAELPDLGGAGDVAGVTADPGEIDIDLPGLEIVDNALPYLGTRYVWGGTTPSGFDCSGFVYFVLNQSGHFVPRDHGGQMRVGDRVPRTDLEPGDLVFFQNTYMAGISHGGIYLGDGEFIHANTPGSGVIVSNLSDSYWVNHWAGATRVAA